MRVQFALLLACVYMYFAVTEAYLSICLLVYQCPPTSYEAECELSLFFCSRIMSSDRQVLLVELK